MYYQWIHEDLKRLRSRGIPEGQRTIAFHVPIANRLDENTNLGSDIEQFRRLAKIGEQLDVVVETQKPSMNASERVAFTEKIIPGLALRSSALFDAISEDVETSWIEAPQGSLPWYFNEAKTALCTGDAKGAQTVLDAAQELLSTAKPIEKADYWHMMGRLRSFEMKEAECLAAYDQACNLTGDAERHLIPWAEADLRFRFRVENSTDFSQTLARLKKESPGIVGMRARLMAAEGRYAEAIAESQKIDALERFVAQAIIYSMQAKWTEVLDTCANGLAVTPLREGAKQLFYILRARANFSIAIGPKALKEAETHLPPSGPPGANPTLIREAWNDISEAIGHLRKAGWPGNVELIADVWSGVASMLGYQEKTLPLMEEASKAKPTLHTLTAGVESLAAQIGNLKLALLANERLKPDQLTTLRRVVLLSQDGRHKDCIELFDGLGDVGCIESPVLGFAISLAIFSAHKMVRSDLVEKWTRVIEARMDLAPNLALLRYFQTVSQRVLARDDALEELEVQYDRLGSPFIIAKHLYYELDVTKEKQAQRCIQLSSALKEKQLLDEDDNLRLAQAYITLGEWSELLQLTSQALNQYANSDRLAAIQALALDKLGRTADAHELLQKLINKPDPDNLALNTYVNIASVSGFSEDAMRCVESVYERETNKKKQIECLRHLFSLIQLNDPSNTRLVDIAWTIGEKVDRECEAQEGLFLMALFSATLPVSMPLNDARKAEFQHRLAKFCERYPDSKILKRVQLPDEPDPSELLRIIKEAVGVDEEQVRWRARMQNQLKHGALPIPYAWRPRQIIESIPDLPTLWECSKLSKWDDRHLHLVMALNEWKPVPLERMRGRTPLIDIISLLVINDLNLFDSLFSIFPKIAIGKATLLELQHWISPMSGSPYRNKCLELREKLKARFVQIEQPSVEPREDDSLQKARWSSQELIEIAKDRDYILYSDDAIFRIFATEADESRDTLCSLDLMLAADSAGVLTARGVAERIANLCLWRVGVVIQPRYQLAIIPESIASAGSVKKRIEILSADEACNAIYSGIWTVGKEFSELLGHAGITLQFLAKNRANDVDTIAALAGFWLGKVKLHPNAPSPSVNILAMLIIQAMAIDECREETSIRLWSVYRTIIEIEHGDRMDDARYNESIAIIGLEAAKAELEFSLPRNDTLENRLLMGLTNGTTDYDLFKNAYTEARINNFQSKSYRS